MRPTFRTPRKGDGSFTARHALIALAVVSMGFSAMYWWSVQTVLTGHWPIALAYTAILTFAPPALMSFLIPWSPAGMLLQRIHARTWGYAVIITATLFLLYYAIELLWSWWASQQVVADASLILQQVGIGIIGFILVPALLWAPVSADELAERVNQAHLVRRYELQVESDIALLRATLMRAQQQALKGFANLTVAEREELADAFVALVRGIDQTLGEIAHSVKQVSGATLPFASLADNDQVRTYLDFIAETLAKPMLPEESEPDAAPPAAAPAPRQSPARPSSRPSAPPAPEPAQQAMF